MEKETIDLALISSIFFSLEVVDVRYRAFLFSPRILVVQLLWNSLTSDMFPVSPGRC